MRCVAIMLAGMTILCYLCIKVEKQREEDKIQNMILRVYGDDDTTQGCVQYYEDNYKNY